MRGSCSEQPRVMFGSLCGEAGYLERGHHWKRQERQLLDMMKVVHFFLVSFISLGAQLSSGFSGVNFLLAHPGNPPHAPAIEVPMERMGRGHPTSNLPISGPASVLLCPT